MTSACIVTFNSAQEVKGALDSLVQTKAEVFVVDNASTDGTAEMIRANYPQVRLIETGKNLGFGAGNNKVLNLLESKYHLIMNPDISFEDDIVSKMEAYMDANPHVALLSPRVYFSNGQEQFVPKRRPTIRFMVAGTFEKYGWPFTAWRKRYTGQDMDMEKPFEETFATGCFMFIRTEVFKKIKGFDERFFMYMEDADLTLRVLKEGKAFYNPDFKVIHAWQRESYQNPVLKKMHMASMKAFMRKWGWRI